MVASFQAAYRSGSSSPTSSGSARSWWTLKKYLGIEIKRQPLCLVPDIRQNLVLKDHAFRVVLREPRFRGILVCEHLEVIRVANLLAGVDVDKNGHWSLFSLRLPKWDCLPDSSNGGGGGTRTQAQLLNEAANDPSALQNAALGSPTLVQVFLRPRGFGGQSARGRESTPGRTHRSCEVGKNMQSAAVARIDHCGPLFLAACHLVLVLYYRGMTDREIEILFRRLRLYDRLERRAEGLVRTIQRVMKERYGNARTIEVARRQGGQLAMDQRARRTAAARHA